MSSEFEYPDHKCDFCNGKGQARMRPRSRARIKLMQCPICDGTGYRLTEFGKDLIDFLNRRGFIRQQPDTAKETP